MAESSLEDVPAPIEHLDNRSDHFASDRWAEVWLASVVAPVMRLAVGLEQRSAAECCNSDNLCIVDRPAKQQEPATGLCN